MQIPLDLLREMDSAAREIAFEAGSILMGGFRSQSTTISYKSRTDMVTSMDSESEKFICREIWKRFPGHAIVAEEGSGRETGSDYLWYVDPLDATNNYAHGIPFFCVSIAAMLKSSGKIVCGAVYDPCHDELFHACRGSGAFLNGKAIRVSETSDHGIALFSTGFPYAKDDMEHNNLKELARILPQIQCIRRLGSAALDLCYTACGRIDGYWEPMLKPWDTAAGSLVLTEAGGTVSRYNGDPFDPEFPEIAATNGKLHGYLVGMLCGN